VDISFPLIPAHLWVPHSLIIGCLRVPFPGKNIRNMKPAATWSTEVNNTWSFTSAPLNPSIVQCYRRISNGLWTKKTAIYLIENWPHLACERHSTFRQVDKKKLNETSYYSQWGATESLGTAAITGVLYQPQMIGDGDCGKFGGMKIGKGN
jgi:hypothetical protein